MPASALRVAASVLCLLAAISLATAKEQRLWVDPPPERATSASDGAASAPITAEPEPSIQPRQDVEVTGSIGAWPDPALDPEAPLNTASAPRSSCTTKTYTVLSGATVRVHAC